MKSHIFAFLKVSFVFLFLTSCFDLDDLEPTVDSDYEFSVILKTTSSLENSLDDCFNGANYEARVTLSGPSGYLQQETVTVNNATQYLEDESFDFDSFSQSGDYTITVYINNQIVTIDEKTVTEYDIENDDYEDKNVYISDSDFSCQQ